MNNDQIKAPRHIAFIMDGNGRWAGQRGLPREQGHRFGVKAFENVLKCCERRGVDVVTVYAFSTENWKRPQKEVDSIMKLLDEYLDECERELLKNDVRFIFLGSKAPFSPSIRQKMERIEERSRGNRRIVNMALNYGGRDEIVYAANRLLESGKRRITEEDLSASLYTAESPELDMIVRTGGDLRISNFLLWQAAYAELYFTDKLWPDFKESDVDEAVENFKNRKRRFGGV